MVMAKLRRLSRRMWMPVTASKETSHYSKFNPRKKGCGEVLRGLMKNLIRFQGAVAQLARAPALQAGCRGFEPLRLHQATNVSLRCIAVLRCRTLIERSGSNGPGSQVRADFGRHHPISQARVRRSRTECRRAGSPKSTRSFCEAKDPRPVAEGWQLFGEIRAYSSVG